MDSKHTNALTKILVVDDDIEIMKYLINNAFKREIRSQKYEFDFAHSRTDALEKIKKNYYHLELIDIVMPDDDLQSLSKRDLILPDVENLHLKSGLILVKQIKEKYPEQKSVILSSYGNNIEYLKCGFEVGACDYIYKPLEKKQLEQIIDKHCLPNKSRLIKTPDESQEKKIHYNTLFKLVRELNSELNYKLTLENIGRFNLDQFEELRKNLPILEKQVKEEEQKRKILSHKDRERVKQGKLPLLPIIDGSIDSKPYTYTTKTGEVRRYQYLYLRLPNSDGSFTSKRIEKEHLKDPDVRQIIEEKLGRSVESDFL
jgi:YesN/AraC family two-component response regulator